MNKIIEGKQNFMHLQRHVVRAGGKPIRMLIVFDSVHLISMTLNGNDWLNTYSNLLAVLQRLLN